MDPVLAAVLPPVRNAAEGRLISFGATLGSVPSAPNFENELVRLGYVLDMAVRHLAQVRAEPLILYARNHRVELADDPRSEGSRVGKECVSTCKSRWSPYL